MCYTPGVQDWRQMCWSHCTYSRMVVKTVPVPGWVDKFPKTIQQWKDRKMENDSSSPGRTLESAACSDGRAKREAPDTGQYEGTPSCCSRHSAPQTFPLRNRSNVQTSLKGGSHRSTSREACTFLSRGWIGCLETCELMLPLQAFQSLESVQFFFVNPHFCWALIFSFCRWATKLIENSFYFTNLAMFKPTYIGQRLASTEIKYLDIVNIGNKHF